MKFRCALKNLAIHHAISNAVITNLGGIKEFLKIYPDFGIGLDSPAFTNMVKDAYENALATAEIVLKVLVTLSILPTAIKATFFCAF